MRMNNINFYILFCSALLTCGLLFSQDNPQYAAYAYSSNSNHKCSCGCSCRADCNCGCEQSGQCNCSNQCDDENCCCGVWGGVEYLEPSPCAPHAFYENIDMRNAHCHGSIGVWLPEDPPLFRPFVADPRQVTYSAGWRFNDQVLVKNVIDVSFADTFPIYRFINVWPWCGDLEFDLEGGVWAVFDPLHDSSPLMNADYYVGIPITYAIDCWQFRLRGYHISCHIGDEFLLNHPHFHRRNPSAEFLDFFVSHDFTNEIRLYSGVGVVVAQDESFRTGRWYAETGLEIRMPRFGFYSCMQRLYGEPFYGMHLRFHPEFKRHVDMTYVLGYEFGKTCGLCRKLRIFMEYHDGYSAEGQFEKFPTNYFAVRASYGF